MKNITEQEGIAVCECGTKAFEVKEVGVYYPADIARCAPDENGRMIYRPVPRSSEHAYFVLVCVKCAKKLIPPSVTPEAEQVQEQLVAATKKR